MAGRTAQAASHVKDTQPRSQLQVFGQLSRRRMAAGVELVYAREVVGGERAMPRVEAVERFVDLPAQVALPVMACYGGRLLCGHGNVLTVMGDRSAAATPEGLRTVVPKKADSAVLS
ncbi:hypothetical protein [Streptomyces sp. R41]|uniref:Uncharacterized protein n=1 Tax=Streptomyces sp. R41 TaxID=3238632 RepID=A0AB39R8E6_9ACTN